MRKSFKPDVNLFFETRPKTPRSWGQQRRSQFTTARVAVALIAGEFAGTAINREMFPCPSVLHF
jgi:hypothetical protein